MFVVVFQQVCTDLGWDFGPLLFADPLQILKVPRLSLGNPKLLLRFNEIRKGIFMDRRTDPKMTKHTRSENKPVGV